MESIELISAVIKNIPENYVVWALLGFLLGAVTMAVLAAIVAFRWMRQRNKATTSQSFLNCTFVGSSTGLEESDSSRTSIDPEGSISSTSIDYIEVMSQEEFENLPEQEQRDRTLYFTM